MPSQQRLRELFDYEDGNLITRIGTRGRRAGKAIGGANGRYSCAYVDGYYRAVHRFIWVWHYGDIPDGLYLDHIDHNTFNNRIENLRLVNNSQNGRNRSPDPKSESGAIGVTRHRNYPDKWRATITIGTFDTLEEAIAARRSVEEFLGFHPNHGRMV